MKDLLVKIASVANALDEMGHEEEAKKMTEILKSAAKKIDTSYVDTAIDKLDSSFSSVARRLEGPTARKTLQEAGINPRKIARFLDDMEENISKFRGFIKGE